MATTAVIRAYAVRGLGYALLAAMGGVLAGPAAATETLTTLQADGSYSLGNAAPAAVHDALPADPVDVVNFSNSGADSSGLHSCGSSVGFFGTRSSGGGTYDISSSFRIAETVTNDTAYAQRATFNFTIAPGLLMNAIGSPLSGNEFVSSGLVFAIKRDGESVYDSSATLTTNVSGTTFGTTGDSSLYAPSGNTGAYYSINGISLTIDLGTIAAGGSFSLSYDLSSFARGSSVIGDSGFNPGGAFYVPDQYHEVPPIEAASRGGPTTNISTGPIIEFDPNHIVDVIPTDIGPGVSQSYASSGDPFDIGLDGLPVYANKGAGPSAAYVLLVRAVPEPAAWALMLAGFGVTGVTLRRRNTLRAVSS